MAGKVNCGSQDEIGQEKLSCTIAYVLSVKHGGGNLPLQGLCGTGQSMRNSRSCSTCKTAKNIS